MAKKTENLKGMDKDELKAKFVALQEVIRANRFKAEGSKSKNVKEVAGLKKQVARILTEMNQTKKIVQSKVKNEKVKKVSKKK